MAGVVYFVQGGESKKLPVKIGYTNGDMRKRLRGLEAGCPYPLVVRATTPGGIHLERRFHRHLIGHWLHHEWFFMSAHLAKVIAQINAGVFDFSVLPDDGGPRIYGRCTAFGVRPLPADFLTPTP